MHLISLLVALLPSSVKGSWIPWYPYTMPLYTTSNHQHTTHLVTHPIVHTKMLILRDNGHHHHHNHGDNHLHQHDHQHQHGHEHVHFPGYKHQQSPLITNTVIFPQPSSQNVHERYNYPEEYSNFKYGYQKDRIRYSEPDIIKYSVPMEESPWKPITNILKYVPKEYIPLNYLGLDAETVSSVVKAALNEINKNPVDLRASRYPTGIQDMIERPVKTLSGLYHGAVFYDEDDPSGGRYGSASNVHIQKNPTINRSLNLNTKCNC